MLYVIFNTSVSRELLRMRGMDGFGGRVRLVDYRVCCVAVGAAGLQDTFALAG